MAETSGNSFERPIKRGDRPASSGDEQPSRGNDERPPRSGGDRPAKGKSRKGGGGKGRDRDERDRKPAVPPALMRGPKPTKAKPVEEPIAEETAEETEADAITDAEAEVAETSPSEEVV